MKILGGLIILIIGLIVVTAGGILLVFTEVPAYIWIMMMVVGILLMVVSARVVSGNGSEEADEDNGLKSGDSQ